MHLLEANLHKTLSIFYENLKLSDFILKIREKHLPVRQEKINFFPALTDLFSCLSINSDMFQKTMLNILSDFAYQIHVY